jgi:hypothetical protein
MNITEIVKQVQLIANRLGASPPLEVDGNDGPKTWTWIGNHLGICLANRGMGDELAAIAESQIGTQEDERHTNRGSAILKYQQATWLPDQGWPWCAAFVDWCLQQLFAKHPELAAKMARPQTAGAFDLINWGQDSGCIVFNPKATSPQRGDLVVYTFSHCGIVAETNGDGFFAIEGNSNIDGARDGYSVVRHPRSLASVNRFIRIPEAIASRLP